MCKEGKNELKKCDKYQTFQVKNINTPPPQKNEKKIRSSVLQRQSLFCKWVLLFVRWDIYWQQYFN